LLTYRRSLASMIVCWPFFFTLLCCWVYHCPKLCNLSQRRWSYTYAGERTDVTRLAACSRPSRVPPI
jgi:hypothetical protein